MSGEGIQNSVNGHNTVEEENDQKGKSEQGNNVLIGLPSEMLQLLIDQARDTLANRKKANKEQTVTEKGKENKKIDETEK